MAKRISAAELEEQQQLWESSARARRDREIRAIRAADPLMAAVADANGLDLIALAKARREAQPATADKPKPKTRRRGAKPRKPRPLTARQVEVVQVVSECKGVIAEAARQLSRDAATIRESYRAAMGKLGKTVVQSRDKARLFARDKRGQELVSADDDRRL